MHKLVLLLLLFVSVPTLAQDIVCNLRFKSVVDGKQVERHQAVRGVVIETMMQDDKHYSVNFSNNILQFSPPNFEDFYRYKVDKDECTLMDFSKPSPPRVQKYSNKGQSFWYPLPF